MSNENQDSIALSFKDLSISSLHPPKPILHNCSGYIRQGGLTAVLGASASGKSMLMKVLAGRLQNLYATGSVNINGVPMDPYDIKNEVCYVPQEDFLMGELTPRETLTNKLLMKTPMHPSNVASQVDILLKSFGLDHVADNPIGTVFVRGLSGGQRKRVEVCSELVAPSSILLLDEPTSGLDGAIAYEVLSVIKNILTAKKGKLSVMISIHQPNSRILDLFDNILLLGNGGMLFFGSILEAAAYFEAIGFPLHRQAQMLTKTMSFEAESEVKNYSPTDVYLQITDTNFGSNYDFDFIGSFRCSQYHTDLVNKLDAFARSGRRNALVRLNEVDVSWKFAQVGQGGAESTAATESLGPPVQSLYLRQYLTLIARDFTLAARDPSLYYLQFILVSFFGFLVGAAFFRLHARIDSSMINIGGGLLWIVMMMSYIQVFKVYHLSRANERFVHEVSNNTYDIFVYWLAELTTTAILLLSFIPGTIFAYSMMNLPLVAYPFTMFVFWLTALTAESLLNVITKFSEDATVSIVSSQAVLVILTVFGGGLFISWDNCPAYWRWLQEISIFTQASRAVIMGVNDHLQYFCNLQYGECYGPLGDIFTCTSLSSDGLSCYIDGRSILYATQGTLKGESKWVPFAYLVLLFGVFRLTVLLFMYYPVKRITYNIQEWFSGVYSRGVIEGIIGLKRVEGQLNAFIAKTTKPIVKESPAMNEESVPLLDAKEFRVGDSDAPLRWTNLSVILKKKSTKLIDNVSGVAQPGRILALMGPSGAGKTTLLNALSRRAPYANITGEVMFGTRTLTSSDLVYVPQFDEFNNNLTVFEQIEFVGAMKCRDVIGMRKRLGRLLQILGLTDKAHTRCSQLTGGELKRVSVGMGMISNPNVLFADEPTTGLDSSASYSIVKYLADLSRITKVVVIMTIHQPAQIVFEMLQDLYLLEGGRLAYSGPLEQTRRYFSRLGYICPNDFNPADYYLDVVSHPPREEVKTWSALFLEWNNSLISRDDGKILSETAAAPLAPDTFSRFKILCQFFIRYYLRDQGFYFLRIAFLIIVALFMGTLFLQLRPTTNNISQYSGAIFFNIWTTLFSAVAATGLMAADRRQAIEQVKNAVMTPSIYCLAQLIVSIPFDLVSSLIYQAIFHWLTNINPSGESFVFAVFITAGHMLLMEAIMLTVVAALRNAMLSVTFAMVVLGYLFLFSGFFIQVSNMPRWIGWISYITPTMYSFDGYLWEIYSTQDFAISGSSGSLSGKEVLDSIYGLYNINAWAEFGTLLGWVAFFRVTHYVIFLYDVYAYLELSSYLLITSKASNKRPDGEYSAVELV